MADNIILNPMTGGDTVKADDAGGGKIQAVKLALGNDNVFDGYVSADNPVPVDANSVVVASVLPTGAATQTTLAAVLAALGGTLTISGSTTVSNFPSNFAVNNFPSGFLSAQSGSWSVAVNNFPATQPVSGSVSVSNFPATQPVSIAAAVGVTDNGGSLTVDGAVTVSNATLAVTQSGSWTVGVTGVSTAAAQATAQVSLDAIKTAVELLDNAVAGSELQVDIVAMPNVTIANFPATQPVSLASVPSHPVTNAGTFAVQVSAALPTGANVIGAVTQSGTWNVGTVTAVTGITNALPAGNNNIGDVDVASIAAGSNTIGNVALASRTSGGLTPFFKFDVDEQKYQIKGSAGCLHRLDLVNMTNAVRWVLIYDALAASVTVGTTTPVLVYEIPTNGDTNGCHLVLNFGLPGVGFATGITIAVMTAKGGTGNPGTDDVHANGLYT